MKSSEGLHFVALDHVRALAVFLVVVYHFLMATHDGHHAGALSFPINALFVEGGTGVGLFMTLSGYLFARLTGNRSVDYRAFMFNRALRLGPLFGLVFLANALPRLAVNPSLLQDGLVWMFSGLILPYWPNGGWSITAELHFYILFPLLLMLMQRDPRLVLLVPLATIALRIVIYMASDGEHLQNMAYWTIVGRIDQFVLGMLAARYADWFVGRHRLAACVAGGWLLAWNGFAWQGGFYGTGHQWIWIGLTTVEGGAYAALIAWYDRSFRMPATGLSARIARIGEWSFSIYLLHFFFIPQWAEWIDLYVVTLDNFYINLLFALPAFAIMAAIGRMSYLFLEKPFLRYRTSYFTKETVTAEPAADWSATSHPVRGQ